MQNKPKAHISITVDLKASVGSDPCQDLQRPPETCPKAERVAVNIIDSFIFPPGEKDQQGGEQVGRGDFLVFMVSFQIFNFYIQCSISSHYSAIQI